MKPKYPVEKSGAVKSSTVNHYPDGSSDTFIELESGTRIVYSDAAPLPSGHVLLAVGVSSNMEKTMVRLHPKLFDTTGRPKIPVRIKVAKTQALMFARNDEVFEAEEIHDQTAGITYKER